MCLFKDLIEKRYEITRVFTPREIGENAAIRRMHGDLGEERIAQNFESKISAKRSACLNEAHGRLITRCFYANNFHIRRPSPSPTFDLVGAAFIVTKFFKWHGHCGA